MTYNLGFLRVCRTDYLNAPQSFYNMSESEWVSNLKSLPEIATSINLKINFDPLEISRANLDNSFKVPIPMSHIKKKSVQVQLIANYRTKVCFAQQFCCQSPGPSEHVGFLRPRHQNYLQLQIYPTERFCHISCPRRRIHITGK